MIEVFRTNITTWEQAQKITATLKQRFPAYLINFDLEDCDHIMRISTEACPINDGEISSLMNKLGFLAEVLPDDIPQILEFKDVG